jgi:hypothetical protein
VSWVDTCSAGCNQGSTFAFTAETADAPFAIHNFKVSRAGQTVTISAEIQDEGHGAPSDFSGTVNWSGVTEEHWSNCVEPLYSRTAFARNLAEAPAFPHTRAAPAAILQCGFTLTASHEYVKGAEGNGEVTLAVKDDGSASNKAEGAFPLPGTATTRKATGVTQQTATLEGSVNPSKSPVKRCYFKWGTESTYGKEIPCKTLPPESPETEVSAELTGLAMNTEYHYAVVLETGIGTFEGQDEHFRTEEPVAVGAPAVVTDAASAITQSGAELHGEVNPKGPATADCHFEWGTDTGYGHTAPCAPSAPAGSSGTVVSAALTGLTADTTYHFRMAASNPGSATSYGADGTFTTLPSCEVDANFGYVDAKGCFSHVGSTYLSTPGSAVGLDGLTLTPDEADVTITVDPAHNKVSSSGRVKVSAGEVVLYDGAIAWIEPTTNGINPVKIGALTPPPGAGVGGLALEGSVALSFNHNKGADLAGNIELPLGKLTSSLGVNGTVELHTTLGIGLLHDQITATKSSLEIGAVKVKNLKVVYSPTDDLWEGGAEVVLPTPNKI